MALDPTAATAAYIDSLGPQALAKAHAYTLGGHWLLLWGLLVSAFVTWIIVRTGALDRLERRIPERRRALRAFSIVAIFSVISAILTLPWSLYADYFREKGYGRTSQPLADFLVQSTIGVAVGTLLFSLFMIGVYWLIRKTGRGWWLWAGGLTFAALAFMMLVAPVVIEPLFNKYEAIPAGPVHDAVADMAGRAGIPENKIYMYDGSRQSNNFTANAGGIGSTAQVAISDVAMKNATLDEVRAVTGHEIGHYTLKHSWWGVLIFSLLALLLFWVADRTFPWFARRFGSSAGLGDPRGIPVLAFMLGLFGLLALPLINSFARTIESDADNYSLRTENRPDALSTALVKTAEYRYPRPGAIEEVIFYDHPSVERRVLNAMTWKAQHPTP